MARAWIEDGKINCLSEVCNFTCPRWSQRTCIEITSPLEIELERDRLKKLSEAQKEYIELLGKEIDNHSGFLFAHGVTTTDRVIKESARLRSKIREVEAE